MGRLLLSLAIFLISTSAVAAQVQFRGCFADQSCTTFVMEGPSSNAEDCCVNNNAGLYYNDGGQCTLCIVYGWGSDTFTRPEAQFPYDFPLAYFKGPPDAQLRMAIDYNGEGTALEGEFGIGQSVVSLPLNPGGTTSITFQADRVALEPDETFVLELTLLGVENTIFERFFDSSLSNVFFRNRQEFIIQESTAIVFRLRESDRVVDEGDASISIEVTVANEVELASDISLLLTPMIAPEDFTPLPATRPFARANTIEGRIDFFTTPITLNFMAGGEILLAGDVLIYDDLIDEALEYFVVTLTFQDPDNLPPLASIESNSGDIIRIDTVDNDDIFIGFALPSTTYPEVEADHQIRIIKGAGNVTEQTISFLVNLFQTAPPGLGTATPLDDEEDNDFFIPLILLSIEPEENDTFTDVSIFADELPEVTEAAQLRLSLPTDGVFPVFKTLPQYPSFFIIIADDDSFRIGFERTSYIVNEGIGMLEVCVRILEPPEGTRISVSIGVETVRGTADGSDYREMSGSDAAFVLFFDDVVRRSCINVEITEDNRYEFEEQFSLQLIDLPGSDLPSNYVFDPPTSTIVIRGAPFGGCYSNSSCSGDSLGPTNAEDCCVSSAGTYFSDETTCFQCIVYGWSSSNFPASEAQSPYSIPLVYSKGPAAQIVFTVNDTSKGTATQNVDYIQNQQVVTLSLNAGATVSVTFLIDTIAFEPDETFVLELSVTSITPAASVPLLDASLINVFFQRRQNFIIQDSTVQAQFTGCFTDPDCATAVMGGPSFNSEDCCVSNNAGLYYNQGGQCFQCIVYGFGSDTFTRPESQIPYDVPLAYFKGPSIAQLRMAIDYNGEGTASEEEFGISQSVVTLPLNPGETTSITFQADRVALEPDKTFVLELSLLGVANGVGELFDSSLPNVFFQSRQEFIIQDSTALVFRLRESNRVVDEDDGFISIDVAVANEVELASDISLVLTPMIAPENFRPLPTTRPFARANTSKLNINFLVII
ncbi:uncharacterized protein LOC135335892 isoform X2 [Halichondria panicea]|uniref:uncharacterized protein LOC135335892 isoform X2 n=1 Tax=Halichondria panicea TaxID=6063 RepID=UPI00312B4E5E